MSLRSGTHLGPYEILSLIGAGGMGEVYKARDTRLNRTVAIKVLAQHISGKPELKQRFEREAQAIASLNHAHICVLHDVGHRDGVDYLVMEYLEGQTLAARLEKGPLPLDEALKYATQIADALDKAHRQGVIHRDLKPGNIMLASAGPKVLDFGLAKLATAEGSAIPATVSAAPTDGRGLTLDGAIVGTLQYMSPEQLEGKAADARSDVFAFGATLYEMVTGKKAFEGKSQVSLMAAILEHDPKPVSAIQPSVPRSVERLLQICIAKDPEDRLQTMREVIRELKWTIDNPEHAVGIATRKSRGWLAWSIAAGLLILSLGLAVAYLSRDPVPLPTLRFPVFPPDGAIFTRSLGAALQIALSPDGKYLAFAAAKDGKTYLYVRRLDTLDTKVIAGIENATQLFWSPDNRFIGFVADRKLKRVEVANGSVQILCQVPAGVLAGTWNSDGAILFGGNYAGAAITKVSAEGGIMSPVTKLGPQESSHRFPRFLPDGRHFIYLATGRHEAAPDL